MPSFMNDMHLTGKTMGYLVAVFAMAQLITSPITGRWVDLYGREENDNHWIIYFWCFRASFWIRKRCVDALCGKGIRRN